MGKAKKNKTMKGLVQRVNPRLLRIMNMTQEQLWAYIAFTLLPTLRLPCVIQRDFIAVPGTCDVGMMAHMDTSKPVGKIVVDPDSLILSLEREGVNKELAKKAAEMERQWDSLKVQWDQSFPLVTRRYQHGRDGKYELWVNDRLSSDSMPLEEYKKLHPEIYEELEAKGMVSSSEEKEQRLGFCYTDINDMKRKAGVYSSSHNLCLGGDDRAGVYACICMLRRKLRPTIIFTTDEESGCVGAKTFVEYGWLLAPSVHEMLKEAKAFIQIDRRSYIDCVFYNNEQQAWVKYVESFGFQRAVGSTSDVRHIAKAYGRCGVNLAAGFMNEHGESETLNYRALSSTIRKTMRLVDSLHKDDIVWELKPDPPKVIVPPARSTALTKTEVDPHWYGEEDETEVLEDILTGRFDREQKKKSSDMAGTRKSSRIGGRQHLDSLDKQTELLREMKRRQTTWHITGGHKYNSLDLQLVERPCHWCHDPMFLLIHRTVLGEILVIADVNYGDDTNLSIPFFSWAKDQDYRLCMACRIWYLSDIVQVPKH